MKLDGYFINLDRSADRCASMQQQLDELGFGHYIKRFAAIDGRALGPFATTGANGVWACRRSHEEVIRQASDTSATIVFEDDVEISRYFSSSIHEGSVAQLVERAPQLDVIFLVCCAFFQQIPLLLATAEQQFRRRAGTDLTDADRHAPHGIALLDAKSVYAYCAAAYIVTPKGKATLRRLFDETTNAAIPIDILYRDWIASGALNAIITVPFLAKPEFTNTSTIAYEELPESDRISVRACDLTGAVSNLLFAGDADLDLNALESVMRETDDSPEYRLGMRIYDAWRAQPD
jgi:GR25 family glycosyltransferase involved in LPS biosynthesis